MASAATPGRRPGCDVGVKFRKIREAQWVIDHNKEVGAENVGDLIGWIDLARF